MAMVIGNKKVYLEETDSTNYQLYMLSRSTRLEEGYLIYTGYQHKGRTRSSHGWNAGRDKNILMSFYLRPIEFEASRAFEISMAMCIGLVNAFKEKGLMEAQIKWPNDIFIGHKKIAGVLIDNLIQGDRLQSAIVGMGINVNEDFFPEFDYDATSFFLETGFEWDLTLLMGHVLEYLNREYEAIYHESLLSRKARFESLLMGFQSWQDFELPGQEVSKGWLSGIDEYGRLLVELPSNPVQPFQMGEIRMKIRKVR